MGKAITFITGNSAKATQLSRYFSLPVSHKKISLPEIQSLDLEEVVSYKARAAYAVIKQPVLVEDTSLVFHALGKLPGPLIKWFLAELGNKGLCKLLDGYGDRSATARVLFGIFDGKQLRTFSGKRMGSIAKHPRGEEVFGWDQIFMPKGHKKTWAEMTREEQRETSMRRVALKKLEQYLRSRS